MDSIQLVKIILFKNQVETYPISYSNDEKLEKVLFQNK